MHKVHRFDWAKGEQLRTISLGLSEKPGYNGPPPHLHAEVAYCNGHLAGAYQNNGHHSIRMRMET